MYEKHLHFSSFDFYLLKKKKKKNICLATDWNILPQKMGVHSHYFVSRLTAAVNVTK